MYACARAHPRVCMCVLEGEGEGDHVEHAGCCARGIWAAKAVEPKQQGSGCNYHGYESVCSVRRVKSSNLMTAKRQANTCLCPFVCAWMCTINPV